MKKTVMKKITVKPIVWAAHVLLLGILLNGCSDPANQQHSRAANVNDNKIIALQTAVNQANHAHEAIIKAGNNQRLALQEAQHQQAAVQQAMAQAAKEAQQLRQDAENKSRWANKVHQKALASEQVLLQAAMQQAHAKQQLLAAKKAVQNARHQLQIDQQDAQLAIKMQHEADRALGFVLEAEQLAALSMDGFTTNRSDKNQPPVNQTPAIKNITVPNNSYKTTKKGVAQHQIVKQTQNRKVIVKTTHRVRNTAITVTKKPTEYRSLKLASLTTKQTYNLQRGHKLTQKCLLCHNLKPSQKKKFGPGLFAVIDQPAGKSKRYNYSRSLAKANFTWNEENLAQWICHSGKSIKQLTGRKNARTKMSNQRICGQDAKDVVAYLRTVQTSNSTASSNTAPSRTIPGNTIARNSLTAS